MPRNVMEFYDKQYLYKINPKKASDMIIYSTNGSRALYLN